MKSILKKEEYIELGLNRDAESAVELAEDSVLFPHEPARKRKAIFKKITSIYQETIRWVNRENFIAQLICFAYLKYPIINPDDHGNIQIQTHCWLRGYGLPIANSHATQFAIRIHSFFDGMKVITGKYWPILFSSLLLHDLLSYLIYPQQRYGTTSSDIFSGSANNQNSLTTNYGTDLAGRAAYSFWPALFVAIPLLAGFYNLARHLHWHHELTNDQLNNLSQKLTILVDKSKTWCDYLPLNLFSDGLLQAETAIIRDAKLTSFDRKNLFNAIEKLATEGYALSQLAAISSLAKLADSFHPTDIANLTSERLFEDLLEIRSRANITLKNLSTFSGKHTFKNYLFLLPKKLLANYELWSVGSSRNFKNHLIAWLVSLYVIYTNARLWQLWIEKIIGLNAFLQARQECESMQKIFQYAPWLGQYICAYCPDWPVADQATTQGCLDGLLSQVRAPGNILVGLNRLVPLGNIQRVDFSRQKWWQWQSQHWQEVLDALLPLNNFQTFNLSTLNPNFNWPQDNKIQLLSNFLNQVNVTQLDLGNLGMGQTAINDLMVVVASHLSEMNYLNLAGNAIGNGFYQFPILSNTSLQILNIANNNADDEALLYLSETLSQVRSLRILDLSQNNQFTVAGLEKFYSDLSSSQLTVLRLNAIKNIAVSLARLSQSIPDTLSELQLNDANLSDDDVIRFVPYINNLPNLSLNYNQIGVRGFVGLLKAAVNSSLNNLALAHNLVDDIALATAAPLIPATQLIQLNLADNLFTAQSLIQFGSNIGHLELLNLADNQLSGQGFKVFIEALVSTSNNLNVLDFSANNLDDSGIVESAENLAKTHLLQLNLRDNPITDISVNKLVTAAVNLTNLDLSGSQITATGVAELMIVESQLNQLSLANINLGNKAADALGFYLIKPKPIDFYDLTDIKIDIDTAREINSASAATHLININLRNTQLDTKTARLLCRLKPIAGFVEFDISENSLIDSHQVDLLSCANLADFNSELFIPNTSQNISPNSVTTRSLVTGNTSQNISESSSNNSYMAAGFCIPLLGAALFLVLLYRYITPLLTRTRILNQKMLAIPPAVNTDTTITETYNPELRF